jgi:CRP-like cAMP-binding protein
MLDDNPLETLRDRMFLLRSLPNFAPLDDESLSLISEHARGRHFGKGETLIAEGEPVANLYFVLDGAVRVTKNGQHVALVERPMGVGVSAFLARDPEGCSAVAERDAKTLELPSQALIEAMEVRFPILRNSLRLMAQNLVRKRGDLPIRPDRAPPAQLGDHFTRPRTLVEKILAVKSAPLFKDANLDSVSELARCSREVRLTAGERIFEIGDRADFQLRIVYGQVRCTAADGQSVVVGADFNLGGLDAMGEGKRSYSAVADTEVIAYRMQTADFLSVLETHFDLAIGLLSVLARSNLAGS